MCLSFPAAGSVVRRDCRRSGHQRADGAAPGRASRDIRLAIEIKVLMLHGLLHLAGYDHEIDEGGWRGGSGLLRARLGLPQGLIERAAVTAQPSAEPKVRLSRERGIPKSQGLKPADSIRETQNRLGAKAQPSASEAESPTSAACKAADSRGYADEAAAPSRGRHEP